MMSGFLKVIGQTALKKIILIFCGHRLIYHGEASPAGAKLLKKFDQNFLLFGR